ncbi:MAG TPA: response regulator [Candidatus Methylomirabilis sp.]|jgi:CheY-like chemotaxis protein
MPKVLIVDDEIHIVKIIAYKLRGAGYDVASAADGVEALEAVRADRPDLILLDIMMPRMDGYQTLETLKGDPATRDIPVFLLTVKSREADRQRGWQLGCDDYITKPFSPAKLLERIDQTLRRGGGAVG